MKKRFLFAAVLFASVGVFAFNAEIKGGWPFSAPHVGDKDNMESSYFSAGDIVYDQTDNAYYGVKNTGTGTTWIELGGSVPSNFVTTSDNKEWGTESAKVSAAGVVSAESGDWLVGDASISDSSLFSLSIKSGIFSSAPNCVLTVVFNGTGAAYTAKLNAEPTTSNLAVRTGWTSSNVDFNKQAVPFHVICQGPR